MKNAELLRIALISAAAASELVNLIILVKYRDSRPAKTGLKVFFAEGFFVLGAFASRRLRRRHGELEKKRLRLLSELCDSREAAAIARNAGYAAFSYIMFFTPPILLLSAFGRTEPIAFCGVLFLLFLCLYFDFWLESKVKERRESIKADFAALLTKMSLLSGAGLTAAEAFERVAFSSDGILYFELKRTVCDMKNGLSAEEALDGLALRCGCREMKKFVSLYKQNLEKGGRDFPFLLSQTAAAAWNEKKNRARLKGELASQKLLLPVMLMFFGILLMILIPAFKNFTG